MDSKKAASDYFEAIYLKNHPKKFDSQRAAMLKRLKNRKKVKKNVKTGK